MSGPFDPQGIQLSPTGMGVPSPAGTGLTPADGGPPGAQPIAGLLNLSTLNWPLLHSLAAGTPPASSPLSPIANFLSGLGQSLGQGQNHDTDPDPSLLPKPDLSKLIPTPKEPPDRRAYDAPPQTSPYTAAELFSGANVWNQFQAANPFGPRR